VTLENSPSKVAAADQPFSHFISSDAEVSAESAACAAPLTTKLAPGSIWKVVAIERSGLIMRPCEATTQRQRAGFVGEGLVGTEAEFATCVRDALGDIAQGERGRARNW
jgi:hypothetical protein